MRPRPPAVKHNQQQKHIPHQHHHLPHLSSSAPSTSLLLSLSSSVIDTMKTQRTAMSTTRGSVTTLNTAHDSDRNTSSMAVHWHQSSRQLRENREVCLWWEVISKPSWVSVDVVDFVICPCVWFLLLLLLFLFYKIISLFVISYSLSSSLQLPGHFSRYSTYNIHNIGNFLPQIATSRWQCACPSVPTIHLPHERWRNSVREIMRQTKARAPGERGVWG